MKSLHSSNHSFRSGTNYYKTLRNDPTLLALTLYNIKGKHFSWKGLVLKKNDGCVTNISNIDEEFSQ